MCVFAELIILGKNEHACTHACTFIVGGGGGGGVASPAPPRAEQQSVCRWVVPRPNFGAGTVLFTQLCASECAHECVCVYSLVCISSGSGRMMSGGAGAGAGANVHTMHVSTDRLH